MTYSIQLAVPNGRRNCLLCGIMVMRDNDGRKLNHRTLESMRLRAVDAVEFGVHPEDVPPSLGMARGTVSGWLARYRAGGTRCGCQRAGRYRVGHRS